jgi:hypothetical protein
MVNSIEDSVALHQVKLRIQNSDEQHLLHEERNVAACRKPDAWTHSETIKYRHSLLGEL